jgi:hypothetical protein
LKPGGIQVQRSCLGSKAKKAVEGGGRKGRREGSGAWRTKELLKEVKQETWPLDLTPGALMALWSCFHVGLIKDGRV